VKHTICPGSAGEGTTAAIAPLDVNGDGDMDVLTGAGPLASGPTAHEMYFFENTAGPNHDPVFVLHKLSEYLSPEDGAKLAAGYSSDHLHEPCIGDVHGDGTIDVGHQGIRRQVH
jgi:hypothetical protein